ncbi:MAG TPA: hypothetical protein VM077_04440 [Candidatus Limnocylindrales bacterium]|nr:hypothetical protein [Candidatus Limnocylindrales bacterium]
MKRIYIVGGEIKVQELQMRCFSRKGLAVSQIDLPSEPPLKGLGDAMAKGARFAVVNIGRDEVTGSGLNGEDVVEQLRSASSGITIVTFNFDDPDLKPPGAYAHIQRTFQIKSYLELTKTFLETPDREITIPPNPKYL